MTKLYLKRKGSIYSAIARVQTKTGAFHELEIRTQASARFLFDAGGNCYLISALRPEKGSDKAREIYGLIFSADYLKDQLLRPALLQDSG